MHFKDRLWMYSLVTGVAVLIWFWAAAETQAQRGATFAVRFAPSPSAPAQIVSPRQADVTVELEGSRLALQRAVKLSSLELTVGNELPSKPGRLDIVEVLERDDELRETGVRVVSADPPYIELKIDHLVTVVAPIKEHLPGIEFDGDVTVSPNQTEVSLPGELRGELNRLGFDLTVQAHLLQTSLEGLEPGRNYNLPARLTLRLPGEIKGNWTVTLDPPTATINFKVLSRIKAVTLPTVRVQIAGPPEDHEEYLVEIEDRALSDVTIKAEDTLIQQIERGQATIVALVHLSTNEKERRIESKPVTCFMALLPEGRAAIVDAEVAGSSQPPVIRLKISERAGS